MVLRCSRASVTSSLPPGASMVSTSSMFISTVPMRILRAKIVSLAGGTASFCANETECDPRSQMAALRQKMRKGEACLAHADTTPIWRFGELFQPRHLLGAQVRGEALPGLHKRDLLEGTAAARSIPQRAELDYDAVAGFYGIPAPSAGAHQIAWRGHLHEPILLFRLLAVDDPFDQQTDVRIDPAKLQHDSANAHGLRVIEHGRRVVGGHEPGAERQAHQGAKAQGSKSCHQIFSSSVLTICSVNRRFCREELVHDWATSRARHRELGHLLGVTMFPQGCRSISTKTWLPLSSTRSE